VAVVPLTWSESVFIFGQQAGDIAQSVISSTPQTLSNAWQNVGKVVDEHGRIAFEHLNNIVTELNTNHIPRVMNGVDSFAQEALTVYIPKTFEKLGQVKDEPLKVVQWLTNHPVEAAGTFVSGAVGLCPVLITGPVLWAAGFGGLGPVGGESTARPCLSTPSKLL